MEVADFVDSNKIDVSKLEKARDSLKHIRDKTHFHVDKDAVKDPKAIWDEAKIKGQELAKDIDIVYRILDHLYVLETGKSFYIPKYSGADATKIAKYASNL